MARRSVVALLIKEIPRNCYRGSRSEAYFYCYILDRNNNSNIDICYTGANLVLPGAWKRHSMAKPAALLFLHYFYVISRYVALA